MPDTKADPDEDIPVANEESDDESELFRKLNSFHIESETA